LGSSGWRTAEANPDADPLEDGAPEAADPPQYGRRLHVDDDPGFNEFMFGWDWVEPDREVRLESAAIRGR
jgi:hypothetical protein